MLINFSTIANLIPKDGRLILSLSKKMVKNEETEEVKEISIVFAQHFKGKEEDGDFSPIILSGSIDELNDMFESAVTEISQDQTKLAELKARPAASKVDAKKKQLSNAIAKASKTASPAVKKEEAKKEESKKEPEKEAAKKPTPVNMFDLFAQKPAKTSKEALKPEEKPASLPETEPAPSIPEDSSVEEVIITEDKDLAAGGAI